MLAQLFPTIAMHCNDEFELDDWVHEFFCPVSGEEWVALDNLFEEVDDLESFYGGYQGADDHLIRALKKFEGSLPFGMGDDEWIVLEPSQDDLFSFCMESLEEMLTG